MLIMIKKALKPLKYPSLLIVHCSATKCNRPFSTENLIATGEAKYGQVSYHYYIRMNGDVIPLLPESVQGVHARHYNHCSIGICYEGGLNEHGVAEDTRTEAQKHAMFELLKELTKEYPKARIIGHCELPHVAKDCPCFPASKFYLKLQPENRNYYFAD